MGSISSKLRSKIEQWLRDEDRNEYGDPRDTMYAGGTPLFDERTGRTVDRYTYILQKHPHLGAGSED
ncbi:MAG: hypothetical protein IT204_18330 [Fimbriimonadaceae bacterium]|nr:hypothetical protein [Fimbriimonadaceae bacterium]